MYPMLQKRVVTVGVVGVQSSIMQKTPPKLCFECGDSGCSGCKAMLIFLTAKHLAESNVKIGLMLLNLKGEARDRT